VLLSPTPLPPPSLLILLTLIGSYGVSYLVKENYLYFHITSWKASGKSTEAFGR
jgi:hypothetical protein